MEAARWGWELRAGGRRGGGERLGRGGGVLGAGEQKGWGVGWVRGRGGRGAVEGRTAASPPPQPVLTLIACLQAALCWGCAAQTLSPGSSSAPHPPQRPWSLRRRPEPETRPLARDDHEGVLKSLREWLPAFPWQRSDGRVLGSWVSSWVPRRGWGRLVWQPAEPGRAASKLALCKSHVSALPNIRAPIPYSTALKIIILYFQQNVHSDNYLYSYCVAASTDHQENYVPVESRFK